MKVVKPIEAILSVTTEISNGDLTRTVTTPSKDEMGRLAGAIETMRKGLVELTHTGIQKNKDWMPHQVQYDG